MTEQQLGGYLIEEQLGEGTFTWVYQALDEKSKRHVALKILKPVWLSDPQAVARFKQEAKTMATKLHHPNIAVIYEVGEAEGQVYLAQFLAKGETLSAKLEREGPLSWSETLDVLRSVASALDYAHGLGIIHRDIKPANILLDNKGQACLGDFGLVRVAEGSSTLSAIDIIGMSAYMAPEQREGKEVTPATDVYALSCVAFEMLTGRMLSDAVTPTTVMKQRLIDGSKFPANWPKGVSGAVTDVLKRGLAENPAERISNASELVSALEAAADQEQMRFALPPTAWLGATDEQQYKLKPGRNTLGRATDADIQVDTGGMEVSRRHATIEFDGGRITVYDEGSANGTFINNQRIGAEGHSLKPGDKLRLGDITFSLRTDPVPAGSSAAVANASAKVAAPEAVQSQPGKGRLWALIGLVTVGLICSGLGAYFLLIRSVSRASSAGMVKIPAGVYTVGHDSGGRDYEVAQAIDLAPFWIDKFEVTNSKYAKYAKNHSYPPDQAEYPVRRVAWDDAVAYCKWAGKRLPAEAEWEAAARSEIGWMYPWGDDLSIAGPLPGDGAYPVGAFLPDHGFLGAFDMAHNVHEWVDNPYANVSDNERVLRGGSWLLPIDLVSRIVGDPNSSTMIEMAGFRCAADADKIDEATPVDRLSRDEFDNVQSGWDVGLGTNPGYHLPDWYHVEASKSEPIVLVGSEGNSTRSDISMVAEIFVSEEQTINDGDFRYGLVARQISNDAYYAFAISPNMQRWYVLKQKSGEQVILGQGAEESLEGLVKRNILRLDTSGTTFAFSINGRLVHQFTDPEAPPTGKVGFYVETLGASKAHIHVDFVDMSALRPNPIATPPAIQSSLYPRLLNDLYQLEVKR